MSNPLSSNMTLRGAAAGRPSAVAAEAVAAEADKAEAQRQKTASSSSSDSSSSSAPRVKTEAADEPSDSKGELIDRVADQRITKLERSIGDIHSLLQRLTTTGLVGSTPPASPRGSLSSRPAAVHSAGHKREGNGEVRAAHIQDTVLGDTNAGLLAISKDEGALMTGIASGTVTHPPPPHSAALPARLTWSPDDHPTTAKDLFTAMMAERVAPPSRSFKTRGQFLTSVTSAATAFIRDGQGDHAIRMIELVEVVLDLESKHSWSVADAYYWAMQRLVNERAHQLFGPGGSAWCGRAAFDTTVGRPRSPTKPAPTKKTSSRTDLVCSKHGVGGHSTAQCRVLATEKKGTANKAASD